MVEVRGERSRRRMEWLVMTTSKRPRVGGRGGGALVVFSVDVVDDPIHKNMSYIAISEH